MNYKEISKSELEDLLAMENKIHEGFIKEKLSLDMSRGKPCSEQLDLSLPMLDILTRKFKSPGKQDLRNYGIVDGIPEIRQLFAELIGVKVEEVIAGGNSSLNMMYDALQRAMQFGMRGGKPWNKSNKVKFICPAPGYDRHFYVTETLNFEMITVPMTENGPDMDLVEKIAASDDSVKGIWCVPRFSNPEGVVYSDETVDRLAGMQAAKDFVIMWDNAYMAHELYDDAPDVKNILTACKEAGNPDRALIFGSTSKITFPGAGVAFMAASEANIKNAVKYISMQTIGPDKMNQYSHYEFLKNAANIKEHMKKHAEILKPKFELVIKYFKDNFSDTDLISWSEPKGGYFISLNVMSGCAKRTVELCKKAGLILTPAGSTYPLKLDDLDRNIRIAPTLPPIEELDKACQILVCCIKIAMYEKLIA
jgi:DNA-binding transcriptional MocR family regulator